MPWETIEILWLRCPECGSNHFNICGPISLNGRVIKTHTIYCAQPACTHVWRLRNSKLLKSELKLKRRKVIRKNAEILC